METIKKIAMKRYRLLNNFYMKFQGTAEFSGKLKIKIIY